MKEVHERKEKAQHNLSFCRYWHRCILWDLVSLGSGLCHLPRPFDRRIS
jgi:hypothetical protein